MQHLEETKDEKDQLKCRREELTIVKDYVIREQGGANNAMAGGRSFQWEVPIRRQQCPHGRAHDGLALLW